MEWTSAVSLAARVSKEGYKQRHTIQKYWTKAKAYLDMGKTHIAVTGHAGAGKTLLAGQMHGRARDLAYEIPKESRAVEVDAITAGAWTKLVRVLPGQTGYRTKGEIDIFQDNPALEGVIHVVDYGYVAPRDSVIANTLITIDGLDTVEKLQQRNLRLEIDSLKVLLSDIRRLHSQYKRPKWLVIAVNKVDLFPTAREAALSFYHPAGTGEFGQILRDFQAELGKTNIDIHVLQACAYETDLIWNGHCVSSSLKRNEQDSILKGFMESIAAISEANDE